MKTEEKILEVHEGQKVKFIAADGRSIVVEIKTIVPEEAQELVNSNLEDRKVNHGYVSQYARDMKDGKWELNGSTILIDTAKKRIDGQHRLLGCIEAGAAFTTLLVSEVENDVKLTVDQGRNRTLSDHVSVAGYDPSVGAAIRGYLALAKLDRAENGQDYRRVTMRELMTELETSPELYNRATKYATKVAKCMTELKNKAIASSYVYLVKDMGYDEKKITEFFNQVAQLSNNTSATRALSLTLSQWKKNHEGKSCPATTQQVLVIKAWNSFINDEDVDYISYSAKVDKSVKFQ